ncbi:hypothetical protein GJAV_G00162280 [Gymnothorax javanicus]|nr:hypothetical protein GJAV_G00162280 [Gymnothorax javanicus]
MLDGDSISECSSDVVIEVAESLQLFPGLLAVAIVFGVFFGITAAALLYVFFLKPVLINRKFQSYDTRKLFEADDFDQEDNKSDSASIGKKAGQCTLQNDKERKQLPMNSDVAAFALKAKVVYPINQRYRPLADGASNPSLHENSRLAVLPNAESSSSSSLDSLSQENDEDSSQFVTSFPIPDTFQNERFIRVDHFPETFTCTGFEGRISLYALGLQNFQQLCSKLQEEEHVFFLQILRILFEGSFCKEKIDSAFYSNILLTQEKELQDLKKELSVKLFHSERKEDPNSVYCTVEEIEQTGKDRLEQGLQMVMGFSRQVEQLCLHLRCRASTFSDESATQMTRRLIHSLLQVETRLTEFQITCTRSAQENLLWWEELTTWLQSQPSLLRLEAVCRLRMVAKTLEQLTSDSHLSFGHMEKILSELHGLLREDVQQCHEDCLKQTKELVNEMYSKAEAKIKKLMKSQAKERSRTTNNAQYLRDPLEFVEVYCDVLKRQRKQSSDLEEQQEWSVTEAVCGLWKRLHSSWSEKLAERVAEVFLNTLPAQTQLTADQCAQLRQEAEQDLSRQLQKEEAAVKHNLQGLQEQLELERQMCLEEDSLVSASLQHMCDEQLKILRGMLVKQKDLQESVDTLMEEKHRLLLVFGISPRVPDFTLRVLKEMRLSRLKMPAVSDSKVLELGDYCKIQHTPNLTPEQSIRISLPVKLKGAWGQKLCSFDRASSMSSYQSSTLGQSLFKNMPKCCLDSRKHHLVEGASESVYVTRSSISALIQGYDTQIQSITKTQLHSLESPGGKCNEASGRSQMYRALQQELANWERKPTSREFYQRVETQKRKILAQYDVDLETAYGTLRTRKSELHQKRENLQVQLQEAEETFMTQLAALSRVALTSRESKLADSRAGEELQDDGNLGLRKE